MITVGMLVQLSILPVACVNFIFCTLPVYLTSDQQCCTDGAVRQLRIWTWCRFIPGPVSAFLPDLIGTTRLTLATLALQSAQFIVTNLVPKGMELMLTRGSGANAGICRLALVSDLKPGSCAMPGRAANGSLDPDSHWSLLRCIQISV